MFMGFDGCCCGCTEWCDPFLAPSILEEFWVPESGEWTRNTTTEYYDAGSLCPSPNYHYGHIACSGDGSLLCRRKCEDESGSVYAGIREGSLCYGDYEIERRIIIAEPQSWLLNHWVYSSEAVFLTLLKGPDGVMEECYGTYSRPSLENYQTPPTAITVRDGIVFTAFGAAEGAFKRPGSMSVFDVRFKSTTERPGFFQAPRMYRYTSEQDAVSICNPDEPTCVGHPKCMMPYRVQLDLSGFGRSQWGIDYSYINGSYLCKRYGGGASCTDSDEDAYTSIAGMYGYDVENSYVYWDIGGWWRMRPTPFVEIYSNGKVLVTVGSEAQVYGFSYHKHRFHANSTHDGNTDFRYLNHSSLLLGGFDTPGVAA